jgi:MYXO-CTERM domain-containing protein
MRHFVSAIASLGVLALAPLAAAQDATTAGAVTTPHPTLEHLSIEWAIDGDADEDGVVRVRFREQGASAWRDGMPLLRVPGGSNEGVSWANRHAGSLFALTPDTAYEIELTLTDPDGGSDTRTVTARTRPVPTVPASARIVDATPATVDAVVSAASPGDVVLLGPGTYGSITVTSDGDPGAPIVVRGSSVAEVIVDGEVRMDGRAHVFIEDLTVRGQIKFNDASNIVVRGCRVEAMTSTGDGIVSYGSGSADGYFADNVVIGRTVWAEASLGASGDNIGEGIVMTGPGNVIAHNRVSGFRDCVSLLEGGEAVDQTSVDIIDNDLFLCADDAIEADFAMGNVRVMRNRMVDVFIALSSQPGLGGPTYFVRNVMFGIVFQAFKPHRGSLGDLWLHNTVVKPGDAMGVYAGRAWGRALFRNNLLIGGTGGGTYNGFDNGTGRVLEIADADEASCDLDYDGFGSIGTGMFAGRVGATRFASLAELRSMTTEAHAVEVDLSVFAVSVTFPDDPLSRHEPADLRLTSGAAAVDVGTPIANIDDGFAGTAPDLGAHELGSALPTYGPRTGPPVCGDGAVDVGETCDDGNTRPGDGCNESCLIELADGGVVLPPDAGRLPDGGTLPGVDAGTVDPGDDGGCGCRVHGGRSRGGAWSALLLGLALVIRRRRLGPLGA